MGRRHSRRAAAAAVTFALLGGMALTGVAAAPPALADTVITVTTTTDGGPGSLRAAVDTANASAQPVTIELAATTYDLTTCAATTEDANVSGDLDLTGAQPVTIHGNAATIHQTCTERVLHTLAGSGGLTIQNTTITGGRGPGGIAIWSGSSLTLDHVTVSDSRGPSNFSGTTDGLQQQAAVASRLGTTGSLTITDSTVSGTVDGAGITDLQTSGGTFVVTRSTVSGNGTAVLTTRLAAGGIVAATRDLTITDTEVTGNNISGEALPPASWPPPNATLDYFAGGITSSVRPLLSGTNSVHGTRLTIKGNAGGISGGILSVPADLHDSVVDGNWGLIDGGICCGAATSGGSPVTASMALDQVQVTNNHSWVGPGGVEGDGTIDRSLIAGNQGGTTAGSADVGGVLLENRSLTVQRTTITGNSGSVGGLRANPPYPSPAPLDLRLDHVTLSDNTSTRGLGNEADNPSGSMEVTASILGAPNEPGPVCNQPALVVSHGFNVVGDSSCLASPLASDAVGVDPLLGPLGDHGGPTQTRVPSALSPARDRVPLADPGCTGTDQRGVARPQGPGCDAGAVEAHLGRFVTQAPTRVVDTRDGTGGHNGPITGTVAVDLPALPAGTTAAVLNVTADRPTAESFLSISPPGTDTTTAVSNLNFPAGRTIANLVTVPIVDPAHPKAVIHNNTGAVQVIGDLAGWFVEDEPDGTTGAGFTATSPKRVLDTRPGTTTGGPVGPLGPGETRTVQITGVDRIPADATAVAVNLTATATTAQSHLTAGPTGATLPAVSNLNWPAGDTIANQAIVPVGPDGAIQIRNNTGTVQVIADVAGWFTPTGGAGYRPVTPVRILDTRPGTTTGGPAGPLGPGATRTIDAVQVPTGATAVVANLTGVAPTATTHLTAWPTGQPLPTASNLNLPAGAVRPVLATIAVDPQARFDLRNNSGSIDALADLQGYYG
ncbi:MAG: right-handed parallel beta-helix repeat-containing protein [Acidimicrobiales bacterium]